MEKLEQILVKRGYFVTEEGVLYNPKKESIGCYDRDYLISFIRVNGVKRKIKAHRLQAYQKYGDKLYETGIIVRHFDGNSKNNSWDNILIGTQSQNMMDIPKQIRVKSALIATSYVRKYDKNKVKEFYEKEKSYKKTMEYFNISSTGTLHFILNN
jgi:hypothetical protein